jgi:basic membrane protein A
MTKRFATKAALLVLPLLVLGCKKGAKKPPEPDLTKIGIVTDVGGRGDQSFNDGALRGLETWAAGKRYTTRGYEPLAPADLLATIPDDVKATQPIRPLPIQPVVLQAKQQEDYEPNLQLLVEDGVKLAIGVGFMLESSVEAAAKKNPNARFLLIDSPILDANGKAYVLPNVRTITFRENEGAFLVGALAGLVTKTNRVGFVGGMQIPLIRRFEAGFRAGVMTTNPEAGKSLLVGYTGSFDKVEAGKQVAQDMLSKDADVIFHAAGSDGLGAIAAVREAGKWAIGCDSDQHHVAPDVVLTSMIKHVDLAVYLAASDAARGVFGSGHSDLGLKEGGLGYAPLRTSRLENKDQIVAQIEGLKKMVVDGTIRVPATLEELESYQPAIQPPAQPPSKPDTQPPAQP